MKRIDISAFDANNVTVTQKHDGVLLSFAPEGGSLSVNCDKGTIIGTNISKSDYLVMDVCSFDNYSGVVYWDFYENSRENGCRIKMGFIKQLKVRLALPMSAVDGEILFLPRTPGKLKTVYEGYPVFIRNIDTFGIGAPPTPYGTNIMIYDLYISDKEPDYPIPDVKLVDEIGQQKLNNWRGKTADFQQLSAIMIKEYEKEYTQSLADRSEFGGWTKKKFDSSGYFRVQNDGQRYWFVDPDGYAFYSNGIDCVGIDGTCDVKGIEKLCDYVPPAESEAWVNWSGYNYLDFQRLNLMRVFGDDWYSKWYKITSRRLKEWGINTVACWGNLEFARNEKIPYTFIFNGYPEAEKNIFRDFPDVFSEKFKQNADEWAKQIIPYATDKYMIGYFLRNETAWAFVNELNIAEMMMSKDEYFYSKTALKNWLTEKYSSIDNLNSAWGALYESFDVFEGKLSGFSEKAREDLNLFSYEMIREYSKVPSLAVKKYDPNHLNMGLRYAWQSSSNLKAGSEYFDVFSFNCYTINPLSSIEGFVELVDKPVIIGEFHAGALDRGLDTSGIQSVESQEERAVAYRYYVEQAAHHKYCIGTHYFQLNDQSYLGRFDGENCQIGVVDVCQTPYEESVDGMIETNKTIYEVANGDLPPYSREPKVNQRVFF